MKVFLIGVPMTCGGANSEAGHTALLWRRLGIEVTCLYFTKCRCGKPAIIAESTNRWVERLRDDGVEFVAGESGLLRDVPGLPGSVVVDFCNQHLAHNWHELHGLGCRLIHSPCMTMISRHEAEAFRDCPPTALHMQSDFQASQIAEAYRQWGCKRFHLIRGAFDPLPYRPRRREPGETFVVGRLARPCRTKWSPELWGIMELVRENGVRVAALCQAWDSELSFHCGPPPGYATCLSKDTLETGDFLSRCHALICPNWAASENWPRVGLEAMSAGVPVLADDAGGWREMIEHGVTGHLCRTRDDFSNWLLFLAENENERMDVSEEARARLVGKLCDPGKIGQQWIDLIHDCR